MLYRYVRKLYARKSDAEVLVCIVRGEHPYSVEQTPKGWVFTCLVPEARYETLVKAL